MSSDIHDICLNKPREDKRYLITGISGFVGSTMAKHLVATGAEVYGVCRHRSDFSIPRNIMDTNNVKIIECDITDISSVANALDVADPDVVFHLAAQSFVPRSFEKPIETLMANSLGTNNILEAIRIKNINPVLVFAGSSEEYGAVAREHLPIDELVPLNPQSPYAASKVHGDFLCRVYHKAYGIHTIVSRAFNHEGAGRGAQFVTSSISRQVASIMLGESPGIVIGNVNAFRDWSHVDDIIEGYLTLSERGKYGDVYNQGSMRTMSVLSYILLALYIGKYYPDKIETSKFEIEIDSPLAPIVKTTFGVEFERSLVDDMMLEGGLEWKLEHSSIRVLTPKGDVIIIFDRHRYRPAEVPILLSNTKKAQSLGIQQHRSVHNIIRDQINFFLNPEHNKWYSK